MMRAPAAATRRGIAIKAGCFLEQAWPMRILAFDKTGTLTTGRPAILMGALELQVVCHQCWEEVSAAEVLLPSAEAMPLPHQLPHQQLEAGTGVLKCASRAWQGLEEL